MIKWLIVFVIGIAVFSIVLQQQVKGITEVSPLNQMVKSEVVAVNQPNAIPERNHFGVSQAIVPGKDFSGRVPPVQEAPIKEGILAE